MDVFLRTLLAVLVGMAAAAGVPREAGREYRWTVAWERTLERETSGAVEESRLDPNGMYLAVETDHRFALIDLDSGDILSNNLKTEVFHASSQALINQAADAPRWAVQSWDGRILRVVPRHGVPRLHGTTLLQFGEDSTIHADVVTDGTRWSLKLPAHSAVYDLRNDSAGDIWFAVGTLDGTVRVSGSGSEQEWHHALESDLKNNGTSTLYAVQFSAPDPAREQPAYSPPVYIVHGLDSQVVSRLDFDESGGVDRTEIGRIPDEHTVRGPTEVFHVDQNLLVVGMKGALFVGYLRNNEHGTVPLSGLAGLSGVGRATDDLIVATGTGHDGPVILIGDSRMEEYAPWKLSDSSAKVGVHDRSWSESIVILQRDNHIVGLEVTL